MYVDAHIHLYDEEYNGDREEVLREALQRDVELILSVSEDYETSIKNLDMLRVYRPRYKIYIGLGIHPYTAIYNPDDLTRTVELISQYHDTIIAIGEVGLDRKYPDAMKHWDRQVEAFEKMIQLSLEYFKPLNIHSRRAAKHVLALLRKYDVKLAYFHWYTDDEETLKEIVEDGYYVGFTPAILTSKRIQRYTKIVPLTQVFTESDGPVRYYGPLKNARGEPKHIPMIVAKLAELYEVEVEEATIAIRENFKRLFRLQYG